MSGGIPDRVRVALPTHLQRLARVGPEVEVTLPVERAATAQSVLDALESSHPVLRGTIRERRTGARRAYMRYFAGREDWSHREPETPLPRQVVEGTEVFRVLGAIAGG